MLFVLCHYCTKKVQAILSNAKLEVSPNTYNHTIKGHLHLVGASIRCLVADGY